MTAAVLIITAIILILVIWAFGSYNSLVKLNLSCDEAYSTMDVYMKKRFDLIPNLVSTVRGYAEHEARTLEKVVHARNTGISQSVEERVKDENTITHAMRQIFALSESYPDLKANANFMDLLGQLKKIEEDIANSRKYYNGTVKMYNEKTLVVPANIIANMFHFKQRPMFEVADTEERNNIKVEF